MRCLLRRTWAMAKCESEISTSVFFPIQITTGRQRDLSCRSLVRLNESCYREELLRRRLCVIQATTGELLTQPIWLRFNLPIHKRALAQLREAALQPASNKRDSLVLFNPRTLLRPRFLMRWESRLKSNSGMRKAIGVT